MTVRRRRIAFLKYVGLGFGGTERWLQTVAAYLPRDDFDVTFFYADAAPYLGSRTVVPGTDPGRLAWMQDHKVDLVEFTVGAVDLRRRGGPWIGSDLWSHFRPEDFDLVQTAKAGRPEYPFLDLPVPVFEQVTYNGGVDRSPCIVRSGHLSQWQRAWWVERGGDQSKAFVCPIAAYAPASSDDLRAQLGIGPEDVVAGLHQRPSDDTFSPIPLEAFAKVAGRDAWFVLLGGSGRYADQARMLGLNRFVQLEAASEAEIISRFLNTIDVLAHGRRDGETFGAVFAEALMHRVPCISHRVSNGGNAQAETIGPGGIVATSVSEYAENLAWLLRDDGARARFGDAGFAHASERFSISAVVREMVRQYRSYFGDVLSGEVDRPLDIGEVPGGYLVAGDTTDPLDAASAVLTGQRVRPIVVELATSASGVQDVVELGCAPVSAAAAVAAREDAEDLEIVVVELEAGTCRALRETIILNRWEDRIRIVHDDQCVFGTAAPSSPPTAGPTVVAISAGADPVAVAGWIRDASREALLVLTVPPVQELRISLRGLIPGLEVVSVGAEMVGLLGPYGREVPVELRSLAVRAERRVALERAGVRVRRLVLSARERAVATCAPWSRLAASGARSAMDRAKGVGNLRR